MKPSAGGLPRTSVQPGSVYSFESAELYSKVAGFLSHQSVDIGTVVKKGQLLAEIDAPELVRDLERAQAALRKSQSDAKLREAKLRSAQAALRAAKDRVSQAEAEFESAGATVQLRKEQYARTEQLVKTNSIQAELLDERREASQSAEAKLKSAGKSVSVAQSEATSASADVAEAEAALENARAAIDVAIAEQQRAQVMANYLRICSPYDGVITQRNYFNGDFISAADREKGKPILSVGRIDLMRVVVQVPDQDVPLIKQGERATLVLDALPGKKFTGTVARMADHEEYRTRTMRTEVDVPNPDHSLRDGMYGEVTIELGQIESAVTIPSRALFGRGKSERYVYVIHKGKAEKRRVEVGLDNGSKAGILHGLKTEDQVVVAHGPDFAEGRPVQVVDEPLPEQAAQSHQVGHGNSKTHVQ